MISSSSINDGIGIYFAKSNRLKCDVETFQPYVVHRFQDGNQAWMFQGFNFLDLDINGKSLVCRKDVAKAATKKDWEDYINRVFVKGTCYDALDRCIDLNKAILGEPPFRHKVKIALPMPHVGKFNWGRIGSSNMDFSKDSDRIKALKWFIDTFISRFNSQGYKNIDLEGFYWLDEDMENNMSITRDVTNYIRTKGLTTSWNPYLRAKGASKWKEQGFDYANIQPGAYSIKEKFDISRVDEALTKAKNKSMGLVVEFDATLFSKPEVFIMRLENLIEKFEDNNVFSDARMSYYDGAGMIYFISKGKYKNYKITNAQLYQLRNLMDRLAWHIVDRYTRVFSPKNANPYNSVNQQNLPQNNQQPNNSPSNDDWRNPEYWHF